MKISSQLPCLRLYGAKLDSVSLHRDLGLLTSNVLSWNYHIANMTAKANSILGVISKERVGMSVMSQLLDSVL